jgi:glycosyltransferase involved in cell wall biosynthesis
VEAAWLAHFQRSGRLVCVLARLPGGVFSAEAGRLPDLMAVLPAETAPLDLRARLAPRRPLPVRRAESWIRRHGRKLPDGLPGQFIYANVGHADLDRDVFDLLRRNGAAAIVSMIHDVIPLDHPAYASDRSVREFPGRLRAAAASDLILTVSRFSAGRISEHLGALRPGLPLPPIAVSPPGIERAALPRNPETGPGRFLCLGTIEPRKNHGLLLDLWQGFHKTLPGAQVPRLDIIGARGWLNGDLFKRLDQGEFMNVSIFERGPVSDREVREAMAGARALLFPSLAEGFGLPVAEALAAGLPVICSDLPALREAGGDGPLYLPAEDRAAWSAAVLALSRGGPAMAPRFAARTWEDHFGTVEAAIRDIPRRPESRT